MVVASPDTVFTVAVIHKISGISYVVLCGMVVTKMDAFIGCTPEMHSTNFIMIAILYIEYFHHIISSNTI